MSQSAVGAIEGAIDHCLRARARLGPHATPQSTLLLDLLLLDLGRELARLIADGSA